MIDINELKPILEPILTDENAAEVIDKITAIDKPAVTQADIDNLNKEWSDRYKKAFFGGTPEEQAEEQAGEKPEETPDEKTRYEDLFSDEEEK